LEVAIQAEAFYRQELVAGRTYSPDKIERELNKYGEISQQLAIRGEIRGFDEGFVKLFREFGDALGEFADAPGGIGVDRTESWEEIVEQHLDKMKEDIDV
jgi:hypothetical protein